MHKKTFINQSLKSFLNLFSGLCLLLITFYTSTGFAAENCLLCDDEIIDVINCNLIGDANHDNIVNFDDIFVIFNIIASGSSTVTEMADCNQDSIINFDDIFCIFSLIVN